MRINELSFNNAPLKLKVLREYCNLSQRKFAEALGVSNTYISELEKGEQGFSVNLLNRIYQNFGISVSYFFDQGDENYKGETAENIAQLRLEDEMFNYATNDKNMVNNQFNNTEYECDSGKMISSMMFTLDDLYRGPATLSNMKRNTKNYGTLLGIDETALKEQVFEIYKEKKYEIANHLYMARKKLGISQKEMAKLMNINASVLSRLESGKYNPSLKLMIRIAILLGKKFDLQFK